MSDVAPHQPEAAPPDDRPMHIAVVIEGFVPSNGGNERSTSEIVRRLAQRGHNVTILCSICDSTAVPTGVKAINQGAGKPRSARQLRAFRKWALAKLESGGYDTSLSVTMAVPADVVQPRGGTVRETLERNVALRTSPLARMSKRVALKLNPKQRALLAMEKATLRDPAVKRVAALSGYVQRQLAEHYALTGERVVVIPNGADVPAMTNEQKKQARDDIRKAYHVPDDATLFLFAAQNPRLKGFDVLVGALLSLREQGVRAYTLLTGRYSAGDQLALKLAGLIPHTHVIGQSSDMPKLYVAADVTVLPTYYDPSSKVVLESLMLGTPAISTRYNGASDFITPTEGPSRGRVIDDPDDGQALTDAMAELCDPDVRQACRDAMGDVAQQVSMQTHVAALERLLREAGR